MLHVYERDELVPLLEKLGWTTELHSGICTGSPTE